MNTPTIIVSAIIVVILAFALRSTIKHMKGKGGCCGDCSGCSCCNIPQKTAGKEEDEKL